MNDRTREMQVLRGEIYEWLIMDDGEALIHRRCLTRERVEQRQQNSLPYRGGASHKMQMVRYE